MGKSFGIKISILSKSGHSNFSNYCGILILLCYYCVLCAFSIPYSISSASAEQTYSPV